MGTKCGKNLFLVSRMPELKRVFFECEMSPTQFNEQIEICIFIIASYYLS